MKYIATVFMLLSPCYEYDLIYFSVCLLVFLLLDCFSSLLNNLYVHTYIIESILCSYLL